MLQHLTRSDNRLTVKLRIELGQLGQRGVRRRTRRLIQRGRHRVAEHTDGELDLRTEPPVQALRVRNQPRFIPMTVAIPITMERR